MNLLLFCVFRTLVVGYLERVLVPFTFSCNTFFLGRWLLDNAVGNNAFDSSEALLFIRCEVCHASCDISLFGFIL